jgi:hypothetical protein
MDKKPMAKSLMTAKWWRFSDYEIVRDHRQIAFLKPATGAKLIEYDLWSRWEKARPLRQDRPTPYQELLNLLHDMGFTDPGSRPPRDQAKVAELAERHSERILNWCRSYGLLGVLPHQAFFVALEPRRKTGADAIAFWRRIAAHTAGTPAPSELVTQIQYSRTGAPPTHWEEAEQLVKGDAFPPGVLMKTANSAFASASLEFVADFFPFVTRSNDPDGRLAVECPRPLCNEFWYAYAEPVRAFLWEAVALYRAVSAMRIKKYRLGSDKFFEASMGLDALSGLLAPVRPAPEWQPGHGVRQRWSSSSLLGALTMMALSDVPEGEARECEECHKPFVSSGRPQSLYCSKNCRWRAQKRAQRGG